MPKQPLVLHQPPDTTMESPSEDTLELQLLKGLPIAKDPPVKPAMAIEGVEGLSLHRRPFVPLPPICSDSTVHTEETTSRPSDTAGHISPEHPSDEDTKSTESIFLTQVPGSTCPCHSFPVPTGSCAALRWLDRYRQLEASTWRVWKPEGNT